jgi:hypothetical protein
MLGFSMEVEVVIKLDVVGFMFMLICRDGLIELFFYMGIK